MKDEKEVRQALLTAAEDLLQTREKPEGITSREIAAAAGTNAAMINYYYGSKEKLLTEAVEEILDLSSEVFRTPTEPSVPPKEKLRKILKRVCAVVLRYRRFTRVYVPHILLEDEISLPLLILPEIREHFGTGKDEAECRVIAYQMVSFLQLVFYRAEDFLRYTGMSLSEEEACGRLIDLELDLFLPEGDKT